MQVGLHVACCCFLHIYHHSYCVGYLTSDVVKPVWQEFLLSATVGSTVIFKAAMSAAAFHQVPPQVCVLLLCHLYMSCAELGWHTSVFVCPTSYCTKQISVSNVDIACRIVPSFSSYFLVQLAWATVEKKKQTTNADMFDLFCKYICIIIVL